MTSESETFTNRLTSVVLPLPRNPVTTTTGVLPSGITQRRSNLHLQAIEPAAAAVDGKDDAAVVDEHVVQLDLAGLRFLRRRWHEVGDLARRVRIAHVVGAHPR